MAAARSFERAAIHPTVYRSRDFKALRGDMSAARPGGCHFKNIAFISCVDISPLSLLWIVPHTCKSGIMAADVEKSRYQKNQGLH